MHTHTHTHTHHNSYKVLGGGGNIAPTINIKYMYNDENNAGKRKLVTKQEKWEQQQILDTASNYLVHSHMHL